MGHWFPKLQWRAGIDCDDRRPFGNLAASGNPGWIAVGPRLCVPTFRWVCLFEDGELESPILAAGRRTVHLGMHGLELLAGQLKFGNREASNRSVTVTRPAGSVTGVDATEAS